MENGALLYDDEDGDYGNDYTLKPGHRRCWITVDSLSVCIRRHGGGVSVALFKRGWEMDELAEAFAYFPDEEGG